MAIPQQWRLYLRLEMAEDKSARRVSTKVDIEVVMIMDSESYLGMTIALTLNVCENLARDWKVKIQYTFKEQNMIVNHLVTSGVEQELGVHSSSITCSK